LRRGIAGGPKVHGAKARNRVCVLRVVYLGCRRYAPENQQQDPTSAHSGILSQHRNGSGLTLEGYGVV
jgi:hypothetical protein